MSIQDARKTKDPQLSELAGLMNVKDFSKTIVLAEAVSAVLSYEKIAVFSFTHAFTHAVLRL
jgi:hypothetical protein